MKALEYFSNWIFLLLLLCIIIYSKKINNNSNETLKLKSYDKSKPNIYCFWTGDNAMSSNRIKAVNSMSTMQTYANIVLITPNNLANYVKEPLHEAFSYLSLTHKADYLRCYFMHYFGGGYTDIKAHFKSWQGAWEKLKDSDALGVGYAEIEGGVAKTLAPEKWGEVIGNCAYIFKQQSEFTREWLNQTHKKLDELLPTLKLHAPSEPRDHLNKLLKNGTKSQYPVDWTEILGDIFHPLVYKYRTKILRTLPTPSFSNYQ